MEINEYLRPNNLENAYKILTEENGIIIGGGAWIKLTAKHIDKLISLDELELNKIVEKEKTIEIGAMVTLREIELHEEINKLYDGILANAVKQIMGINIRNIATIGGSIIGRFSFSDIFPALLVMDTRLVFYKAGEISLVEYLNNSKFPKDILLKIVIKKEKGTGFFKKVKTTALDFAIINIAVSNSASGFKISLGSTPYMAKLANKAIDFINKEPEINDDVIQKTIEIVLSEFKFSKNVRSSKEYKEELARVYVKRGLRKVM